MIAGYGIEGFAQVNTQGNAAQEGMLFDPCSSVVQSILAPRSILSLPHMKHGTVNRVHGGPACQISELWEGGHSFGDISTNTTH